MQATDAVLEILPLAVLILATIAAIGAVRLVSFVRQNQPDIPESYQSTAEISRQEDSLPPALAGALAQRGNLPEHCYLSAVLFDLANRGAIQVREVEVERGRSRRDFHFTLLAQPDTLRVHEKKLLEVVFGEGYALGESEYLSKMIVKTIGSRHALVETIRQELEAAGYLNRERADLRKMLTGSGMVFSLIGFGTAAAALVSARSFAQAGNWDGLKIALLVMAVGLGVFFLSLLTLFARRYFTGYTVKGLPEAVHWKKRRRRYALSAAGKMETLPADGSIENLPYAAGLGCLADWLHIFTTEGRKSIPGWFTPLSREPEKAKSAFLGLIALSDLS